MLTQIRIRGYKSLFDVTIDLEPLTVFIGPNASGKSNVCEVLSEMSHTDKEIVISQNSDWTSKYWQGQTDIPMIFNLAVQENTGKVYYQKGYRTISAHSIELYVNRIKSPSHPSVLEAIKNVVIYDFTPDQLSQTATTSNNMSSTGHGIANTLVDILLNDRERFMEMEAIFIKLVPNISRISLKNKGHINLLRMVDKYSDHLIPAQDISDGTLRILAFLTALYQMETPSIICFEEPENGIHPWLLHKMIEILKIVSTEGITGKPVQVIITTHSPVLLNYINPKQVRAVEMDEEGKTQIHTLPTNTNRFRAAMDAYDGELGELWFTNLFGGNPQ